MRLLLVEDDPGDAYLVRAMLQQAGVPAEWSLASRLADIDVEVAGGWADCALVDLGLPDCQGLEGIRWFLQRAPQVPVVVVSGNTDRTLALAAVHEGAQDYLIKGRIDAELMTKTVRYAIERKAMERKLQQAQHMARLGRLAGGVGHHFNNLLGIIANYADFVAEVLSRPAPGEAGAWQAARDDVDHIRQAARRAAALTRDLVTFADQDLVQPRVIQLNELITAAREPLAARLGDDVTLKVTIDPGLCPVLADRGHIEQILSVLVDNARDAIPGRGQVTISTASTEDSSDGDGLAPRRWAQLQVTDTGAGIGQEVIGKVFDPFFTTKPVGEGTGLGLAVVHAIATRWGGRVTVRSEPGAGTAMTVLFPGSS